MAVELEFREYDESMAAFEVNLRFPSWIGALGSYGRELFAASLQRQAGAEVRVLAPPPEQGRVIYRLPQSGFLAPEETFLPTLRNRQSLLWPWASPHRFRVKWTLLRPSFQGVRRIAHAHPTPYFLYDPGPVRDTLRELRNGLRAWGRGQVAYSVKTNPLPELLREIRLAGGWAEVTSMDEYRLALTTGFQPSSIVFNGPLKAAGVGPECLGTASLNIDGIEEVSVLEALARVHSAVLSVGLRVCSPFSSPSWSRFGLNVENGEFEEALRAVQRSKYLKLNGLHAHLGTQVEDLRNYCALIRLMNELWVHADLDESGLHDIGGGYPYRHDAGSDGRPLPEQFFGELATNWSGDRPRLVIEPGRILAAPSMLLVCRVLARKSRPREPSIVIVDSGTNHNVMAAFHEHSWSFDETEREVSRFRVCGPLCMEDDILSGEILGPLPIVGSLAIAPNAGAYSLSLSRSFIQPTPSVITIAKGGRSGAAGARGVRRSPLASSFAHASS